MKFIVLSEACGLPFFCLFKWEGKIFSRIYFKKAVDITGLV